MGAALAFGIFVLERNGLFSLVGLIGLLMVIFLAFTFAQVMWESVRDLLKRSKSTRKID